MASKKVSKRAKTKPKKKTIKKSAKKAVRKRRSPSKKSSKKSSKKDTKAEQEAMQAFFEMLYDMVEEEHGRKLRIERKKALYESHVQQVRGHKEFAWFKQQVTKNFARDRDSMMELYRQRIIEARKKGNDHFVEFMRGEMLLLDALRVVDHNYYGVKLVDREGKRPIYEFEDYFDDDVVPEAGELWDIYHEA